MKDKNTKKLRIVNNRVKKYRTYKLNHTHKNKKGKRVNKTLKGGKKFKKKQCAPKPNNDNTLHKITCYSKPDLNKMKQLWNTRHPDSVITYTKPKDIWKALKEKMNNACHDEYCWLNQSFMENNITPNLKNNTFAPKSPITWKKNHYTWLNSNDIENVMKQYEQSYPCFRFIGPTPIDFDSKIYKDKCVWEDLCNFELSKYIDDGIKKIGIIFNTDTHDKSGSHWISLFIDISKKGEEFVFFFDSNGTKVPNEIKKFSNRVISQALSLKTKKYPNGMKKIKFDENHPFVHQESNTECGMYSLYLITSLLKNVHKEGYKFFKEHKITDELMDKLRDKYFNIE